MSQGSNIRLDESIRQSASDIRRKASEYRRNAASKVDESLRSVAGKLENASSSVHRRAEQLPGGQRVSGFAHKAADGLHSAAEYVRTHDTSTIKHNTENALRRYPVQSLVVAAIGGFFIGRMLKEAR